MGTKAPDHGNLPDLTLCTSSSVSFIIVFIYFLRFIYLVERERVHGGEEQREEKNSGRLCAECRDPNEDHSQDTEITIRAETKSRWLNGLHHPGAPLVAFNKLANVFPLKSASPSSELTEPKEDIIGISKIHSVIHKYGYWLSL